jgi:hypothetical protein
MGKLTETLQRAGRASGGAIGFVGGGAAASKPKACAIIVSVKGGADAVSAAIKAGADAVIVQEAGVATAAKDAGVAWGLDARNQAHLSVAHLRDVREQGADFVLVGGDAPFRALAETVEHLDRILVIPRPGADDPMYLQFRALNVVQADAAVLDLNLSASDLAQLTVNAFAQTRLLNEYLRFPVIISLREAPAAEDIVTLARLGASAVWLPNATSEAITKLCEGLENVPRDKENTPSVGNFMGGEGRR